MTIDSMIEVLRYARAELESVPEGAPDVALFIVAREAGIDTNERIIMGPFFDGTLIFTPSEDVKNGPIQIMFNGLGNWYYVYGCFLLDDPMGNTLIPSPAAKAFLTAVPKGMIRTERGLLNKT